MAGLTSTLFASVKLTEIGNRLKTVATDMHSKSTPSAYRRRAAADNSEGLGAASYRQVVLSSGNSEGAVRIFVSHGPTEATVRTSYGNGNCVLSLDRDGAKEIRDLDATNLAEVIDLSARTAITDLTENHMTQVDGDVVIEDLAGITITRTSVNIADPNATGFLF